MRSGRAEIGLAAGWGYPAAEATHSIVGTAASHIGQEHEPGPHAQPPRGSASSSGHVPLRLFLAATAGTLGCSRLTDRASPEPRPWVCRSPQRGNRSHQRSHCGVASTWRCHGLSPGPGPPGWGTTAAKCTTSVSLYLAIAFSFCWTAPRTCKARPVTWQITASCLNTDRLALMRLLLCFIATVAQC